MGGYGGSGWAVKLFITQALSYRLLCSWVSYPALTSSLQPTDRFCTWNRSGAAFAPYKTLAGKVEARTHNLQGDCSTFCQHNSAGGMDYWGHFFTYNKPICDFRKIHCNKTPSTAIFCVITVVWFVRH